MYSVLIDAESEVGARIGRYVPNISKDIGLTFARGAQDAAARIAEGGIDVVVCEHTQGSDAFSFFDSMLRGPGGSLPFILLSETKDADLAIRAMDSRMDYYLPEDTPNFFIELVSRIKLAAERHRSAEQREHSMERSEATVGMMSMRGSPLEDIMGRALEEALKLSRSKVGYIATFNCSSKKLKMIAWSISAMIDSRLKNPPRIYDLDKTGIWGEPIRIMKPVIVNDYDAETVHKKKGTPPGHIKIKRLMMIPVIINGIPVGTAGVANKETDYTDEDEEQFRLFIGNLFSFYEQNIREDASRITENRMIDLIDVLPLGIATLNSAGTFIQSNYAADTYLGPENGGLLNMSLESLEGDGAALIRSLLPKTGPGSPTKSGYFRYARGGRCADIFVTVAYLNNESEGVFWLVSMSDVSVLIRSAGRLRQVRNSVRYFSAYSGHILSKVDDNIGQVLKTTGDGEERTSLERSRRAIGDLIRYFRAESAIGQRLPVWMPLSACASGRPDGFSVAFSADGFSVLADPVFPSMFESLYEASMLRGSDSASVSASEDGAGHLVIAYRSDYPGASENARSNTGGTSDGPYEAIARDIAETSGFRYSSSTAGGTLEVRVTVPGESYSKSTGRDA